MSSAPTSRKAPANVAGVSLTLCIAAILQTAAAQESASPSNDQIETITVSGIRGSEQRAVEVKRNADSIQDSIVAEDIGKLPDTTIADSLQRITGVQINREGGEGTTLNIRGLPQVGTLLNGEVFLTTSSIVAQQPDFGDIPSQLFARADVQKSSMANMLTTGITGTVDLRTHRPFDLDKGFTATAAAQGTRGNLSHKDQPEVNGLFGFHSDRWGVLVSAAYSDLTLENSQDGLDQYGAEIGAEATDGIPTDDTMTQFTYPSEGFLNAYGNAPLPAGVVLLHPSQCTNTGGSWVGTTQNGCDVDVNGDGKATSAFLGSENFTALDRQLERKRTGVNASFQVLLTDNLKLTTDFFLTRENRYNRSTGYQLNAANWMGATFLPIATRSTGVSVTSGFNGGDGTPNTFFTTQRYQEYIGDIETYAENQTDDARSRNANLELAWDNGGRFSAEARGVYGRATQVHYSSYVQFAVSDGALWPNDPPDATANGSYVYPNGNRVFNPYGFQANTIPATVDLTGSHMSIALPASLQTTLANRNAYSLKTITSENNFDREASLGIARLDGHYKFDDNAMRLDFGVRYGRRKADNTNFELVAPVYGGLAYNHTLDANGDETATVVPNAIGCYQRYKAVDIVLNGGGVAGACMAGDPIMGFFRAGALSALGPGQLPPLLGSNFNSHTNLADVRGVQIFGLDPRAMDNVLNFQNSLYPGEIRNVDPGGTWAVELKQTTAYVQGNYKGELGNFPISANVGAKAIRTELGIDQHIVSPDPVAYFLAPIDGGITHSDRSFTDVLPAANFAIDFRRDLKLRVAYAKNMQILDLDTWGSGLTLEYGRDQGEQVFRVLGGSQGGNPNLDPWRSTNYDASLEYYPSPSSVINVAVFYIDVASFISNGTIVRCDLPDQDGVVRNRCVAITGPVQGAGKSLQGVEFGIKQALDFLPGWLSHFGVDANFTYSPSHVGRDVAGNSIPFQDNSREQANGILWYQNDKFQARVAGNYRSKRAVSQDFGGIAGFEEYQAPTFYLDASASYDVLPNLQVYIQGSNLTGEEEHYYLVWPDQRLHTTRFESRYVLGVRGRL